MRGENGKQKPRHTRHEMPIRQVYLYLVLIAFGCFGVVSQPVAQQNLNPQTTINSDRAIPEDNLAYPVLLILQGGGTGSGFYFNTPATQYLVTANHVIADDKRLIDPATNAYNPDAEFRAVSYSRDMSETVRNVLIVNLHQLQTAGRLRADVTADVLVLIVGTLPAMPSNTQPQMMSPVPGVTWAEVAPLGTVGVSREGVKTLDEVIVGNDAMMYGYPTSLGLQQIPEIDPLRPLLRKGIVAGKNLQRRSLVLDCPAYFGNSGGPVFEIDRGPLQTSLRLIGVVEKYVPFTATDARTFEMRTNSGYSVATPMDAVLRLIGQ
jgi:hypothetical protein